MTTEDDVLNQARVDKVFHATRRLQFAGIPTVDMKDRLSVLTLVAGLRQVGVLETWGQQLPLIRDRLIQSGLSTAVSTCVWSTIERPAETPHRDVLVALDERRVAGKPKHVLWLYPGTQEREIYRRPTFTQQQAGSLLQYPPCCVAFESSVMQLLPRQQLDLLIGEVGRDDAALIRRLRRQTALAEPKVPLPDNALRTEQRLPFVLHVACDSCLADDDSPSAFLNARYGSLARQVDADFYALFLAVQETYCQVGLDQPKNRELFLHVRSLHRKFFSNAS